MGYRLCIYSDEQDGKMLQCCGKLFSYTNSDGFRTVKYLIEIGKMTTQEYYFNGDKECDCGYRDIFELGIAGPEFKLSGRELKEFLIYYKLDKEQWIIDTASVNDDLIYIEPFTNTIRANYSDWEDIENFMDTIDENKNYVIRWG